MPKSKLSNTEQVALHIQNLPNDIQPAVEYLRQIILSIDVEILEHIKWNSPSFYYSGQMKDFDPKQYKRDLLAVNLRKDKIICVLPTGMNLSINTQILEGNYTDGRRIVNFSNLEDIQQKEGMLKEVIKERLSLIEK